MKRLLIIWICFFSTLLLASISPGKLHKVHADMEGISNCVDCHEIGEKKTKKKCLDCHDLLQTQIQNNKGLHASKKFSQCSSCHVEHFGRDSKLIHWEGGMDAFDHSQTGYNLEGAHATLSCRDCHTSKNIQNSKALLRAKKDLERTFLGLNTSCLSCHDNEHQGQLSKNCLDCHSMDAWTSIPEFDHANTEFPLEGAHTELDCASCHKPNKKKPFEIIYKPIASQSCSNCHTDIHKGSLGANCKSCHTTKSWHQVSSKSFDHNKTNFPLVGLHQSVDCSECHRSEGTRKVPKHDQCITCHKDVHQGDFKKVPYLNDCSYCHNEFGFSPSLFSIKEHNQLTGFEINGSHLAISCAACHKNDALSEDVHLAMPFSDCNSCHTDPHQRQFSDKSCQSCHETMSWDNLNFDHNTDASFSLEGAHQNVACSLCHVQERKGTGTFIRYKPLSSSCSYCH